jgi:RNA polymerase sigma factor (sigma-70 family)
MATSTLNPVIDRLRIAMLMRDGAGPTDGQLLESFVSQQDEAAFAVLVRRHGPMVLGACRRVLSNHHDAEDAFQATFLVLVRKADSIVPRGMVANWLYGVAYRTALKARTILAKQRARERQVKELPEPEAAEADHCWRDLQPLLDQELSRLPDKYRVAVVLCDLEGKTGKETARQLGCPEGTVSSRLARGRTMLAKRLTRHGPVVSGGSLAVALAGNASACVPTAVVSSTIRAASLFAAGKAVATGLISANATALTEGVLRAMLLTKLKIATAVLLAVGVLGAGLGVALTYRTEAAEPAPATRRAEPKSDKERLQGIWQQVSCEGPDEVPDDIVKENLLVIKDDTITVTAGKRGGYELTFKLDESKKPKTMDEMLVKPEKGDKPYLGIYSLEGDTMTWCFSNPGEKRPTEFTGKAGSGWTLTVFKRKLKAKQEGKKAPDEEKPVAQADLNPVQGNPILSSDKFRGKWTGEKDGVKVDLTFNGEQARWQAHWQMEFRVSRTPEIPQQPPTVGVNRGADLKCVADVKAGYLKLYLPRYTGNDEEFKQLPAFNGGAPVGQIEGGAEGTLQLRILPIGYKGHAPEDEYPAVEGLILRRAEEPSK